jgi:hypothetical protein
MGFETGAHLAAPSTAARTIVSTRHARAVASVHSEDSVSIVDVCSANPARCRRQRATLGRAPRHPASNTGAYRTHRSGAYRCQIWMRAANRYWGIQEGSWNPEHCDKPDIGVVSGAASDITHARDAENAPGH